MIDKKIVIAALARDCNEALINNIPRIEKLRELFTESHVVIVENDSKDGTKDTLQKWQEKATKEQRQFHKPQMTIHIPQRVCIVSKK